MTVQKLNQLLARELGRVRQTDRGIYEWERSDELWWPFCYSGRSIERRSPGGIIYFEKEYKREPQSRKLDKQWVITKWFPPEDLADWKARFSGADYPADGYRIFSDWVNPKGMIPTLADTEDCIKCTKEALSMNYNQRLADMEAEAARVEKSQDSERFAMVRDSFTAFLNEAPGKRGNSVSMPWTKEDRI